MTGSSGRHLFIVTADILADNDRTARRKSRKQENHHRVKGRHQRYARNIRFAGKADHKSVRDSHEHQKKLFNEQWKDQIS